MEKGVSVLISMVFVIMITVSAIAVVLQFGLPAIQKMKEAASIGEAETVMEILDNSVRQTASEGVGTFKKVQISVTDGAYRVNPESDSLTYNITLSSDFLPPGSVTEGSLQKNVAVGDGGTELQMKVRYSSINLTGDFRAERGPHSVCFEKTGDDGTVEVDVSNC